MKKKALRFAVKSVQTTYLPVEMLRRKTISSLSAGYFKISERGSDLIMIPEQKH